MRDWEALISERLGALDGNEAQRGEIVRELADHLEDFYLRNAREDLPSLRP